MNTIHLATFLLLFLLVSPGSSKDGQKEPAKENPALSEYPFQDDHLKFDRALLESIGMFLEFKSPDELLKSRTVSEILFDGKKWEGKGNSAAFKVIVRKKDREIPINKNGDYLLWKLPSSKHAKGRDRMVGIYWPKGKTPKVFFAQLRIFAAER